MAPVADASPQFDFVHRYAVVGGHTVVATVVDRDNGQAQASASATVNGLPLAIASAAFTTGSIPEGGLVVQQADAAGNPLPPIIQPALLSGTIAPTRPTDTNSVTIDWGDGTASRATVDQAAHSFAATHIYLDNPTAQPAGFYTATVTASDQTAGTATASAQIQVTNEPPVITALATAVPSVDENGVATLTGAFTDPGILDSQTATIDWGDGTHSAATIDAIHQTFSATHRYLNNLAYTAGVPAAYQITATVLDKDGTSGSRTTQETVFNIAPALANLAVTNLAVTTANPVEFQPLTLSGHVVDPGSQDTETVTIAWGDGNSDTVSVDALSRSFSVVHTYADVLSPSQASITHQASVTVADDVTSTSTGLPIAVFAANLAVTGLAATPGFVNEGGSTSITGGFTDGAAATTHTVLFYWGDGTQSAGTVDEAHATIGGAHAYVNNPPGQQQGTFTVTATVTDSAGLLGAATTSVTVQDLAPSVIDLLTDAPSIDEGGAVLLSGQVTDPGTADQETVAVAWGDGTTSAATIDLATRLFTASHTYADNPAGQSDGSFAITATASDDVGDTGAATTGIVVHNVSPVVSGLSLTAPSVVVGSPVTLSGVVSDPGLLDAETVSVAWGDGVSTAATIDQATRAFSATHTYTMDSTGNIGGRFAISATATDKDGGQGAASTTVTVTAAATIAPTLSGVGFGTAAISEGDAAVLSGTIGNAAAGDVLSVDWGDGSITRATLAVATPAFSLAHTYLNNPAGQPNGSYQVAASVSDGVDPASIAAASVTVHNIAPSWTALSDTSGAANKTPAGQLITFNGAFTDPGIDDGHTLIIGFGDSTKATTVTLAPGVTRFAIQHAYAKAGSYYVTIQITDSDGATSTTKPAFAYVGPAASIVHAAPLDAVAMPPATPQAMTIGTPVATSVATPATISPTPITAVVPSSSGSSRAPAATVGVTGILADNAVITATARDAGTDSIQLIRSSRIVIHMPVPAPRLPAKHPASLFDLETGDLTGVALATGIAGPIDFGGDWLVLPSYAHAG